MLFTYYILRKMRKFEAYALAIFDLLSIMSDAEEKDIKSMVTVSMFDEAVNSHESSAIVDFYLLTVIYMHYFDVSTANKLMQDSLIV